MPGLRSEGGEGAAAAEQSTVQQALRGGGGSSLRECIGAASGAALQIAGEHGTGDRSEISGAMDDGAAQTGAPPNGGGRDSSGEEAEVPDGGVQPGNWRTPVVRSGTKKETLDEFFQRELNARQCRRIEVACVDMWEPYRLSIEQWAPSCRIVYDKFHIMQHANDAIDEVRREEFFRKGGRIRGLVKGKRWLLLSRWVNLTAGKRQELNHLFALNRKMFKAYLLKESLDRLWTYRYEGAILNYLQQWVDQLRWQRLKP